MNGHLLRVAPGVYASLRACSLAELADLIVFDVDGVLVDVSASLPQVVASAVQRYLAEAGFEAEGLALQAHDIADFKAAGGFNDDWDLAYAVVLFYLVRARAEGHRNVADLRRLKPTLADVSRQLSRTGGGLTGFQDVVLEALTAAQRRAVTGELDRSRLEELLMELYAGDASPEVYGHVPEGPRGEGLMQRERPLVTAMDLPPGARCGVYTGRTRGELRQSLRMLGLESLFDDNAIITRDSGVSKPDPAGLRQLAERFGPRVMLYVGDNVDDWIAAARYETDRPRHLAPCLFGGVLGGAPGALAWTVLQERGVELLADSAASLLAWVKTRMALAARA